MTSRCANNKVQLEREFIPYLYIDNRPPVHADTGYHAATLSMGCYSPDYLESWLRFLREMPGGELGLVGMHH